MSNTPQWPDTEPSRQQLRKVLRLLNNPTADGLREARRICASLSESIPQLGTAAHCYEYRRNAGSDYCSDRSCGRCGPIRMEEEG
ncbi:hypothetical protein ACWD0Z_06125 [Streptomyces sp. NPDC003007]|jgi:hypothetical protein